MSEYDDTTNGSGTMVYGNHWAASEPNAYKWNVAPLKPRMTFFICAGCLAYCDAMDVVVGDFAELHCAFCGSDEIFLADEED